MQRGLDNWIQSYLEYSAHSEAPDKFHFWTAVSVIAGALERKTWIDMGYFQWTPNFYIVFVAPPGIVSKSTTASIGKNLLRQIPEITFGPDAVTWQSLVQSLGESTKSFELESEFHPMSPITIVSSEFGTFLNPNDREMVDVLVSLWDGQIGVWEKATKTSGSDRIENPWINIIACTTPAWIAGNFPEYMIGGGFTSRTIFVYADQKRRLVAYPKGHLPSDFEQLKQDLIHDLEIISTQIIGEYKLTPDAYAWGEAWYENLYYNRPKELDNERFGGYIARKQTHLHKLAMVLAAAESNDLYITDQHLLTADSILKGIEQDMPKVFHQIGRTDVNRVLEEVVTLVKRHRRLPKEVVIREFMARINPNELHEAIAGAVASGLIKQVNDGGRMFLAVGEEDNA